MGTWQSIFDDSSFQNGNEDIDFSWNGSAWVSNNFSFFNKGELEVKTGTTWAEGFRPTQVRITWTSSAADKWEVIGQDTSTTNIFFDFSYATSGAELNINWGANDFDKIVFEYYDAGPCVLTVTNIEWFVPTPPVEEGLSSYIGLNGSVNYEYYPRFVGEILGLESFVNDQIDLVSEPVLTIDLCSHINYNVALESCFFDTLALESSIYLEEV